MLEKKNLLVLRFGDNTCYWAAEPPTEELLTKLRITIDCEAGTWTFKDAFGEYTWKIGERRKIWHGYPRSGPIGVYDHTNQKQAIQMVYDAISPDKD